MADSQVRWHLIFYGRVQGVGFRQTCCEYSCQYQIRGWVRNRPDGTVEMVAEGNGGMLPAFVDAVRTNTHGHVERMEKTVEAATGEFPAFQVRH